MEGVIQICSELWSDSIATKYFDSKQIQETHADSLFYTDNFNNVNG